MRLGIVYHMPFWRAADGTLREVEGSFARYVDSLAPYFDEISLCVPVLAEARGEGTPIRASNVTLAALPPFDGPVHFYPKLLGMLPRLWRWVRGIDVLHCRIPSPAAIFAFAFARLASRPAFVLVVGDLQALLPTMPYRGVKRVLWRAYTAFEEWNVQWMTDRSLAFANGAALAAKHSRPTHAVVETTTTTISESDIATRTDTCTGPRVRVLTVSRIDPRKGLRVLPEVVQRLQARRLPVTLDIVGPVVGRPGEDERAAILYDAARLGVGDEVRALGPVPLDRLLPMYRDYDVFVLPTFPGSTIERVENLHGRAFGAAARERGQHEADLPARQEPVCVRPHGLLRSVLTLHGHAPGAHATGTVAGCFSVTRRRADTSDSIRAAWASSVNRRAVS